MMRRIMLLFLMMSLAAGCVPAEQPAQLFSTPGAFVRLDEHVYDAGVFRVAYPPGWRIVKSSIAAGPMQVVFVSPDDTITITVSETPLPEPESAGGLLTRSEDFALNDGRTVSAQGRYPAENADAFEKAWERITQSVQ